MTATAPLRRTRTVAALASLRRDLTSGRYSGDDILPGERDLAASLSVSRTTLRRILADLVEEGLLRHRQGVGTFVLRGERASTAAPPPQAPPPQAPPPQALPRPPRLLGFAEEMGRHGRALSTRDILSAVVLPTPEEAMMLACSPGETILRLVRLRLVDAQGLAVEQAAVPCRYIDRPDMVGTSLYDALERHGFPPVRALQRLQAATIGATDAALLGVAHGSAGVCVRRTAYLANGACCEFTRSTYPGPLYDAVTETLAPTMESTAPAVSSPA